MVQQIETRPGCEETQKESIRSGTESVVCEDPLGSHFENENNFESKKNQASAPQICVGPSNVPIGMVYKTGEEGA
ncbi:hypothetical protein TNCV_3642181 [Trichonephila clavipes]|nr:hypothetical protein TNCV_3642181 [Trichonephila clavipes]